MPAVTDARYYVGEFPTDPLSIQLVDSTGALYDVAEYDSAVLFCDSALPLGLTTIFDVPNAILHHTWLAAFATPGRFMAQVHLTAGVRIDYAPPIAIEVVVADTPNPYWSTER